MTKQDKSKREPQPSERTFADELKSAREAAVLSQKQLASLVGVDPTYVSKLERSARPPSLTVEARLINALKLHGAGRKHFVELAATARRQHAADPAERTIDRVKDHLPRRPTSRQPVGRTRQLTRLYASLQKTATATVLVGEPGIGKTTIAIEIADRFDADGGLVIWADGRDVSASTVGNLQVFLARAMLVSGRSRGFSLRKLLKKLGDLHATLVVDNLEAAEDHDAVFAFLASLAPAITVLVTSRFWPPGNLAMTTVRIQELGDDSAMAVFLHVALARRHRSPGVTELQTIRSICVDVLAGHPGAIEIAAALWTGWPLREILQGLRKEAMETLNDPERRDPQHSMRLSIGLSYDLLAKEDLVAHELLPTLGVVAGSFALETAAAIGECSDVARHLMILVARSLVRFDNDRYQLHAVVREFALERLAGSREAVERRYLQYFSAYAGLHEGDLDALEVEIGNLLGAVDLADALDDRTRAVGLSELLVPVLQKRGYWRERVRRVRRALEISEQAGDGGDAVVLAYRLGHALQDQGEYAKAASAYSRGWRGARRLDNTRLIGIGEIFLGEASLRLGDVGVARVRALSALRLFEGEPEATQAESLLASIEKAAGNPELAREHAKRAYALATKTNDRQSRRLALQELVQLDAMLQDFGAARSHAFLQLEAAEMDDDIVATGDCHVFIGMLFLGDPRGSVDIARAHIIGGKELVEPRGQIRQKIHALEALALLALHDGNADDAVERWMEIASRWETLGNDREARAMLQQAEELAERMVLGQALRNVRRKLKELRRSSDD